MDPLATPDDVGLAWRSLSPAEAIQVATHLQFASAVIRQQVPDLDSRMADGTLATDLVTGIAVAMVVRHLRNPDGLRSTSVQKSIDDYSTTTTETRDAALSAGSIYLTDAELRLLSKRRRAFSVTPGLEPATAGMAETIASHRAGWGR